MFQAIMPRKSSRKKVSWHFQKLKIILRNPAANGAFQIIDNSRLCLLIIPLEMLGYLPDTKTQPYQQITKTLFNEVQDEDNSNTV